MNIYITPEEYNEAAKNGISSKVLNNRIRHLKWSHEKAISYPVINNRNKEISKWADLAEKNGINRMTFFSRVNLGWDVQRAATLCKQTPKRKYSNEIHEKIKKNDIPLEVFYRRVNTLGWDIERAATVPAKRYKTNY